MASGYYNFFKIPLKSSPYTPFLYNSMQNCTNLSNIQHLNAKTIPPTAEITFPQRNTYNYDGNHPFRPNAAQNHPTEGGNHFFTMQHLQL